MVEIWVPDFRAIKFKPGRAPGALAQGNGPFSQPTTIYEIGDLEIEAVNNAGNIFTRKIEDIYVSSVQKEAVELPDGRGVLRLTLLDARRAWDFGWLERWRYNTESESEKDSLEKIARDVVSRLPAANGLKRVPDEWADINPPIVFDTMGSPRDALRRLLSERSAVLCLNDDSSVSIYLENERDTGNELPPPHLIEDMNGQGHVGGAKFMSRPESVMVVGGNREASVTIAGWEPVMLINGDVFLLREGLLFLYYGIQGEPERLPAAEGANDDEKLDKLYARYREIRYEVFRARRVNQTYLIPDLARNIRDVADEIESIGGNAQALRDFANAIEGDSGDDEDKLAEELLARVRRFVVRPDTWQVLAGFDESSTDIIRRDAYRLWRMPGAESYNRELLPILKRAERGGDGKRLQPLVRAYGWKRVAHTFSGRPDPSRLEQIRLEGLMIQQRNRFFDTGEFRDATADQLEAIEKRLAQALGVAEYYNQNSGQAIRNRFAENERLAQIAAAYAENAKAYHSVRSSSDPFYTGDIEDQISGLISEIAQKSFTTGIDFTARDVQDFIRILAASFTPGASPDAFSPESAIAAVQKKYRDQFSDLVNKIVSRKRDAERISSVGSVKRPEVFYFENTGIQIIDREAVVEDPDMGLIRTSFVSGQLTRSGLDAASLAAAGEVAEGPGQDGSWPVVVTFGTHVIPRFFPPVPATGVEASAAGDSFPPQVLEAIRSGKPDLGTYKSVWQFSGGTVSKVRLDSADSGSTKSILSNRLIELIELNGSSNVREIDDQAKTIASAFLTRPSVSEYRRVNYLYPHNTNCDGSISAVSIQSRPGTIGFRTLIVSGLTDAPFDVGNKTTTKHVRIDKMGDAVNLPEELDFRGTVR